MVCILSCKRTKTGHRANQQALGHCLGVLPTTALTLVQKRDAQHRFLQHYFGLRVVFPLRGPRKPPGRKSPKNGETLQNSPPRSDPRKWGKLPQKGVKLLRKYKFCNLYVIFSHFRGVGSGEGNFVIFPHFSGISAPVASRAL